MPNTRLNCVAMVLACLVVGSAEGQSLGRWRLPSTPAQFIGCGYGPGHHAPRVRMPCRAPMSVQRFTVGYPQIGPGNCGYGCVDQPCYGDLGVVQPVPISQGSPSQYLFFAPANPIAPMAPQPDLSEAQDESETLPIPGN